MEIKTILFDLDGTLLPMNLETFSKGYFTALIHKMAPLGYDSAILKKGLLGGISAMKQNDGKTTNEEVFWKVFAAVIGPEILKEKPILDEFYRTDYQKIKAVCGFNPASAKIIAKIKEAGYQVILATNPLFPAIAIESRICWAGLVPKDFAMITTYEHSHYCKPNPAYYQEIVTKQNLDPRKCLMVGNDTTEDVAATQLGMQMFLLTDCLINKENIDITQYPNGSFEDLLAYLHLTV